MKAGDVLDLLAVIKDLCIMQAEVVNMVMVATILFDKLELVLQCASAIYAAD